MTSAKLFHRLRKVTAPATLGLLILLAGCSSNDKRPLLLLDTPLAAWPGTQLVVIDVATGTVPLAHKAIGASVNAEGKYGVYLSDGFSGKVDVLVSFRAESGCELAVGGAQNIDVTAGETTGPLAIDMVAGPVPCSPAVDAGLPDAVAPMDGAGPIDGPRVDAVSGLDANPPIDGARLDGGAADAIADAAADVGADGAGPDVVFTPDLVVQPDAPFGPDGADAASDVAADVATEVAADLPSDLPTPDAVVTPISVMRSCTSYTHTETFTSGPGDWGVVQTVFSPDGKYLITFGQDSRAKLWDVTASGLVVDPSGLVFNGSATGTNSLRGDITADGNLVAVGDAQGAVKIYDLAQSIAAAGGVSVATLPKASVSALVSRVRFVAFTKDGGHLVVGYSSSTSGRGYLALWALAPSPTVLKMLEFEAPSDAWAYLPASYPGPVWVAIAISVPTDASAQPGFALVDLSQATPTPAIVQTDEQVDSLRFAPDGKALYVALYQGKISVWNVANRPIVAASGAIDEGTPSSGLSVWDLAVTSDGRYVAAGLGDGWYAGSVKVMGVEVGASSAQKSLSYTPWAISFAPGNLALAIGEDRFGTVLYCTP